MYAHTPVCMQVTKNFLGDVSRVSPNLSTFLSAHFVFCYVELAQPVIVVWIYDASSNTNVFSSEICIVTAGELQ